MKTREALTVLARHRGDAIVVCALGMAANEWWAVTQSEAPSRAEFCVCAVCLARGRCKWRFRHRLSFDRGTLFCGGFRALFGSVDRFVRLVLDCKDRRYPLERFQVGKVCVKCLGFLGIFRIDPRLTGLKLSFDPINIVRCEVPHESRSGSLMYDSVDLNMSRLS